MPEKTSLRIESVDSVTPGFTGSGDDTAVCVVRCVGGTARLGMVFRHPDYAAGPETSAPRFVLTAIECYGKQVERLDTVHSGRVALTGAGAETLAKRDVLDSAPSPAGVPPQDDDPPCPDPRA
ncbi:hypothetical protein ACFWBV_02030 [Streptomyces sp. NPDC060030]|uniref:hypothetical protein n=1 Tax=Streptomyces sp. NPDC060030 TaxID=3347042 RepID=UPI0036D07025